MQITNNLTVHSAQGQVRDEDFEEQGYDVGRAVTYLEG